MVLVAVATTGLPADWPEVMASSGDSPCVIDKLCDLHDGLVVEAKGIKEHYFKPYIKRLFERKVSSSSQTLLTLSRLGGSALTNFDVV